MKIRELEMEGKLPRMAGRAPIVWISEDGRPGRAEAGCVILLPKAPDVEFFPLKNGEQFIFWGLVQERAGIWRPENLFGGTDGGTFLTTLSLKAYSTFRNDGEEAFYQCLEPEIIQRCKKIWGKRGVRTQGGIFAYPLPCGWNGLGWRARLRSYFFLLHSEVELFGTSHLGRGIFPKIKFLVEGLGEGLGELKSSPKLGRMAVGEGVITAPGRAPLTLERPYIIARCPMTGRDY